MSTVSTLVTAELFRYLSTRTKPEAEHLANLRKASELAGIPPIGIAPEQGVFMQILLSLGQIKRVIEVGTLAGYSALSMVQAMPADGHIDSIEIDETHAAFARQQVADHGEEGRISVHLGDAMDLLPNMEAGSYDAAFIDADKGNYPHYLNHCLRLLRVGGLMMVDNAFAYGHLLEDETTTDDVWAIRAFNDFMAREPKLQSIIVPIGDGLWVGVKTDPADTAE
jgi:predicted O-methyltransferase YrrM